MNVEDLQRLIRYLMVTLIEVLTFLGRERHGHVGLDSASALSMAKTLPAIIMSCLENLVDSCT